MAFWLSLTPRLPLRKPLVNELLETEKRLRKCLGNLYTSNRETRKEILAELVGLGAPAVPGLIRALCGKPDRNMEARLSSVNSFHRSRRIDDVKQEAEEALIAIGEPAITPLVEVLKKNPQGRSHVVQALKAIGPVAHPVLLPLLKHENLDVCLAVSEVLHDSQESETTAALRGIFHDAMQKIHRVKRRRRISTLSIFLGLIVSNILHHYFEYRPADVMVLFQAALWLPAAFTFSINQRGRVVKNAANAADVTMIGGFIACLRDDAEIRAIAEQTLQRLLPQVQASDKQYVSDVEMAILLKQLDGKNFSLVIAILKALEQIGDARAIPKVERIVDAPFSPQYPTRVVEAAQECLPFLQQRAEQSRQASTLLRASEVISTPETLLRPAKEGASVQTEQLLRPHL